MATPTENDVNKLNDNEAEKKPEAAANTNEETVSSETEQAETTGDKVSDKVSDEATVLETMQKDLDAQKALLQESDDRYKRLQADFANFRRRNEKERVELSAVILQGLIKDLLPIVDNFERALSVEKAQGDPLYEGISMVYKQLMASLEKNGLEHIKAVGEKFDPNLHQAVMRVQDSEKEDDTIEEELQKGYTVQGRVIRPSMVKVVAN